MVDPVGHRWDGDRRGIDAEVNRYRCGSEPRLNFGSACSGFTTSMLRVPQPMSATLSRWWGRVRKASETPDFGVEDWHGLGSGIESLIKRLGRVAKRLQSGLSLEPSRFFG